MSQCGLNAYQRTRSRRLVKKAAYTFYNQARTTAVYTQGPARWSGINQHKRSYKGQHPPASDCSSSSTWLYWDATLRYKPKDFVNGAGWKAGYTGTMVQHGKKVTGRKLVGDLVFYGGTPSVPAHVAVYVGNGLVISHGGPGVHLLRWDYRAVHSVRRYLR